MRTQFSNLGDLLINRMVINEALRSGEIYLNISGVPKWYQETLLHGIESSNYKCVGTVGYYTSLFGSLISKRDTVFLFLKPGGYMAAKTTKMNVTRFFQFLLLWGVKRFGGKIVRSPSSQQNSRGVGKLIDKLRFGCVDYHLIRDSESCDQMRLMGFSPVQSYDMATRLFDPELVDALFLKNTCEPKKYKCVLSFRDREGVTNSKQIVRFLNGEDGFAFSSQVFFDDELNSTFASENNFDFACYDGSVNSVAGVCNLYRNSRYVVSNRLHVLMLAASCGAIPIAVVTDKDKKVSFYMDEIGLSSNVIDAAKIPVIDVDAFLSKAKSPDFDFLHEQSKNLQQQFDEILQK